MSNLRRPFTPQRSPTQPASVSSSASSGSSGGGDDRGGIVAAEEEEQASDAARKQKQEAPPTATASSAIGSASATTLPPSHSMGALRGWTAHQSHGQATILFYVPRWTRRDNLHVVIGRDYVVAGVRGEAPVLKARLAGRIDPASSAWQLERRSNSKRYRSRSRTRTRSSDRSSGGGSSGKSQDATRKVSGSGVATGQKSQQRVREVSSTSKQATLDPRGSRSREPSRPISPVHSDSSGFEMLARSTDTLGSNASAASRWSMAGDGNAALPASGLRHSTASSDGSGEADSGSGSGSGSGSAGVRSLESSLSIDPSQTSSSGGRRRAIDDDDDDDDRYGDDVNDPTRDAKLVTLHLDKIDGGIWPCIVAGPVPMKAAQGLPPRTTLTTIDAPQPQQRRQSIAQLISQQSQTSLNAALNEALLPFHERRFRQSSNQSDSDASSAGGEQPVVGDTFADESDLLGGDSDGSASGMINESTATVDTVGSDDSTTVLGARYHHQQQQQQHDEEQYNMDPISLTLLGLQHARRSSGTPFGSAKARDDVHAFECFRRAWREGEVPAATERLVHDYLPLHSTTSNTLAPYRQRLIAGLGGPTAAARLYVSFAHLHMPSCEHSRPLLALPMSGASNNPFGAQSTYGASPSSAASPRLDLEADAVPAGPLQYLLEARRLDANVVISDADWQEAREMDEERVRIAAERSASSPVGAASAWSGAVSPAAAESVFDSDTQAALSGGGSRVRSRRNKRQHKSRRQQRDARHGHSRPSHASATGASVIYLVVSRAALLSVMVAGGVAVAGWWRRAAAAGGGGGGT